MAASQNVFLVHSYRLQSQMAVAKFGICILHFSKQYYGAVAMETRLQARRPRTRGSIPSRDKRFLNSP
jgi:hypothetical protein